MEELLTPQAAAELLHVPVSFIYERTRRNAIPLRRIGKYVRIPKAELLAWLDRPETLNRSGATASSLQR
jgi:excisionase family DNA binding protein